MPIATKTKSKTVPKAKAKPRGRPAKSAASPPGATTLETAMRRLISQPAIGIDDVAALMKVHKSTIQRQAIKGDLPFDVGRIGQRWVVPSAGVRKFLSLDAGGAA